MGVEKMTSGQRIAFANILREYRQVLKQSNLKPIRIKIVVETDELKLRWSKKKQIEPVTLATYYKFGCQGN